MPHALNNYELKKMLHGNEIAVVFFLLWYIGMNIGCDMWYENYSGVGIDWSEGVRRESLAGFL